MEHILTEHQKTVKRGKINIKIYLIEFMHKKVKNLIKATFLLEELLQHQINFLDNYEILKTKNHLNSKFMAIGTEKFEDRKAEEFLYYEDTYLLIQKTT